MNTMGPLEAEPLASELSRIQQRSVVVGVVALAVCLAGALAFHSMTDFLRSYLLGFLFWLGIALGCLAVLMLQHLTGGQWGLVIRRILESGAGTLPLTYVLVLPLVLGLHQLYGWSMPGEVPGGPVNQVYLNARFFLARMAFYFASWFLLAHFLTKWSKEQDETADLALLNRFQSLSGGGLVLYGLTITFASVDWVMSLEPHWASTIYGMLFMTEQALAALAFVIAVLMLLCRRKPLSDFVGPSHFHDLGTLMFAFILLWAYVTFSQFLIIWSGNLLDEIPWYLRRFAGGWLWVALAIVLFHFGLPFLLLLQRSLKRNMRMIATVAVFLLAVRLVNLSWMILPAPTRNQAVGRFSWMDLAAPIGIGGIWIALFIRQLKSRPLLPLHDPRLQTVSVQHE
jgi:hypothetical protein